MTNNNLGSRPSANDSLSPLREQATSCDDNTPMEDVDKQSPTAKSGKISSLRKAAAEKKKHLTKCVVQLREDYLGDNDSPSKGHKDESNETIGNTYFHDKTDIDSRTHQPNTSKSNKTQNNDHQKPATQSVNRYDFLIHLRFSASKKDTIQNHMNILRAFDEALSFCEIYDKHDIPFDIPDNDKEIAGDEFDYQRHSKPNSPHVVVHRVVLSIPYRKLKRLNGMLELLKQNKCYMQCHQWNQSEWDVVKIGFIVGASPKHQSIESIQRNYGEIKHSSVRYRMAMSRIQIMSDGQSLSTLAYEVQCLRTEFKSVCDYLSKVTKECNQDLILSRWRYNSPETVANAITKQNYFINNIRTIPIYGISEQAMQVAYTNLIKRDDILDIIKTHTTNTLGRWNIQTTSPQFENLTKWLQSKLPTLLEACHYNPADEPDGFTPEIRFSRTIIFDTTPDPYLESVNKSVSNYVQHTTKSWASVVTDKTTVSSLTQGKMNPSISEFQDKISSLCNRLDELEEKISALVNIKATVQQFTKRVETSEKDNNDQISKLTDILNVLHNRTTQMMDVTNRLPKPRKLELSYADYAPAKRLDQKMTPTKPKGQKQNTNSATRGSL